METMARLMSEALESPEGMRALAAAIAAPIEQEIKRKEISSLLLTRHTLPKGERPIYQKKPKVKAYWISNEGEAQEQELGKEEVEFPTHRIHSAPMVDVSVLKNGNIGTLMDIQTSAADEIRKEIDKRTITVISAAVPAANTVDHPSMAWGPLGEIYLTEPEPATVVVVDRQGEVLGRWGGRGDGPGFFEKPLGVAVDGAGQVYVVDTYRHRVQRFIVERMPEE